MSGGQSNSAAVSVSIELFREPAGSDESRTIASRFGLTGTRRELMYDRLQLPLSPGSITAVTGPSGSGKSLLLEEIARLVPAAEWLDESALALPDQPAVSVLEGGSLSERLSMLSRCGLAEAAVLTCPAGHLSGGQRYRLALAGALHRANRRGGRQIVLADEFASNLDLPTAQVLAGRVRSLVTSSYNSGDCGDGGIALVLATPREEILRQLRPDVLIRKPLGLPGTVEVPHDARPPWDGKTWPVRRGRLSDYMKLSRFHYLAGAPAANRRVWIIRPPREHRGRAGVPDVAAVLVVSPPVAGCRGRNLALGDRYAGPDRSQALARLNREIECISRVVVHPIYRGCGLADRLIRHALRTAQTPYVECLAAMGDIHPLFGRAGMKPHRVPPNRHMARLLSAAEAVGLTAEQMSAVEPVRRMLCQSGPEAEFLRCEIENCIRHVMDDKRLGRSADPVAEVCARSGRQYIYYLYKQE